MVTADRSEFVRAFRIDDAMLKNVQTVWTIVGPEIDQVLSDFYKVVQTAPETARFFTSPDIAAHAKSSQKQHWTRLFTGGFDADYFDSAERVGAIHYKIDLPFMSYISGYCMACNQMMDVLVRKAQPTLGKGRQVSALCQTLSTLLFIDIQAVIDAYFRAQSADQSKAFQGMSDAIRDLSAGRLDCRITNTPDDPFPARFDEIRGVYNGLCDTLQSVFVHIEDSAGRVKEASAEILSSSESLSDKAQAQAASLEQAAAALTQLSASVQNTRAHFDSVKSVTAENHAHADRGQSVSEQVQAAMQRIDTSSHEIEEIVRSIEEISFQTNLLALNAGVEAARAGESGAGFSIVASEVRALAGRAATATESIKVLIDKNRQDIGKGVNLVGESVAALEKIRTSADNVAREIDGLHTNAGEQALAIREIENTVSHIDGTTQHNAHLAAELTDHCRGLSAQAEHLENPFSVFENATRSRNVDHAEDLRTTVPEKRAARG